ncbi:hypothetical protein BH10ACT3_BH10ACT3_00120 [soil metagenome]
MRASTVPYLTEMCREAVPPEEGSVREMNESSPPTPSTAPDFLTVEEAAEVLRLGRTAAYREARKYEASNGAEGMPVERFGKQFRVPRYPIEAKLGGPITWPLPSATATEAAPPTSKARTSRRRPPRGDEPPRLFSV